MPPLSLSEVDIFESLMSDLTDSMFADIVREFNRSSAFDPATQGLWLSDAVPEIWTPRAVAANDLAADFYKRSAPNLIFDVVTAFIPKPQTIAGQVAWALTQTVALHALTAVAQRDLYGQARRTITDNARKETGAKWARHAKPDACRFCQMTATRGAVYGSEESAKYDMDSYAVKILRVDRYHKHCRCVAVPVRPGMTYEPPEYVERWNADYEQAAKLAGGARTAKSIMAAYRQMDSNKQ
ncbi:hypothetical protein [Nocardia brasiliensis]|uniref:VG15 protein n=1 Tax=Nocardia brasiliensis TaxID=37326 RepID=UPI0024553F93|nr:hypothetical protein [Nocardia brasiliensis]